MEHINYESLKTSEEILRTLADQTRIRIVRLLLTGGESCVCELVDSLDLPQYSVSRHLTALKRVEVIQERRHGKWKYYQVHDQASRLIIKVLDAIIHDVTDDLLENDMSRYMRRVSCRVDGKCVAVKCCCGAPNKDKPRLIIEDL
ncbi:MAG TPA: metalloregulator ArsR/SmtB family transcription factor [Syntrophomonadaceae bacterium]|nr:metalloregulator ArsR/SmtB family transcription factor [Syntrophomonadaceae bacterium]